MLESPDQNSASTLAFKLREALSRGLRRIRVETGPSVVQLAVISHIRHRGPLSTNELAATERVRPQSMFNTVRSLEKAGMVKRSPHPTDGRQMLISLTPRGLATIKNVYSQREDWLASMITGTLTAKERRDLERGLAVIYKIIDTP